MNQKNTNSLKRETYQLEGQRRLGSAKEVAQAVSIPNNYACNTTANSFWGRNSKPVKQSNMTMQFSTFDSQNSLGAPSASLAPKDPR